MTKLGMAHCGVVASGTFGHDHCRNVLADMVEELGAKHADVVFNLRTFMSDDASEEDYAIELINENLVEEGYALEFFEGDLVLQDLGAQS